MWRAIGGMLGLIFGAIAGGIVALFVAAGGPNVDWGALGVFIVVTVGGIFAGVMLGRWPPVVGGLLGLVAGTPIGVLLAAWLCPVRATSVDCPIGVYICDMEFSGPCGEWGPWVMVLATQVVGVVIGVLLTRRFAARRTRD